MNRGGETSTYLFDGQGSVRMLADESGSVTDTYTYDAYGNLTEKTGETKNDYMYCGEQFNSYTQLYNLRARQMDPKLGVFTTADEYPGDLYNPITLNKYMYANADPITYKDPSGYSGELSMADVAVSIAIAGILIAMDTTSPTGLGIAKEQ